MRIKYWTNYMKSVVSPIESPFEGGPGDVKVIINSIFKYSIFNFLFEMGILFNIFID
jgi:hypothetical protein